MRFLMINALSNQSLLSLKTEGERILKIVNICRSYGQESKLVFFFWTQCTSKVVHNIFYHATLSVSAVFAVGTCPSVCHVGVLYPHGWRYCQTYAGLFTLFTSPVRPNALGRLRSRGHPYTLPQINFKQHKLSFPTRSLFNNMRFSLCTSVHFLE